MQCPAQSWGHHLAVDVFGSARIGLGFPLIVNAPRANYQCAGRAYEAAWPAGSQGRSATKTARKLTLVATRQVNAKCDC